MRDTFSIKQFSTSPAIRREFLADGEPIDISGSMVLFTMTSNGVVLVDQQECVVAEDGKSATYYWQNGDTNLAVNALGEFTIIYPDGAVEGAPTEDYIEIRITKALARVTN